MHQAINTPICDVDVDKLSSEISELKTKVDNLAKLSKELENRKT